MKNLKVLFNVIIATGVFALLGTAGLSDNTLIEFNDVAGRIIFSFAIISIGAFGRYIVWQTNRYIQKLKLRYKSNLHAAIRTLKA